MKRILATILAVVFLASASAQTDEWEGSLFDNVVRVLQERYFDEAFRTNELPGIVERFRKRADKAETLREQREVTQALLSHLPATHMGLLSVSGRDRLIGELQNKLQPTLGFELVEYDDKQYARAILEGGPAERAGLRRGDRVLYIDDVPVEQSPRLDWRTDDAYLPDPPVRALFCEEDEIVRFRIDRDWGKIQDIEIKARPYSAYEAAKFSARVIEHEGLRIGHVHFWFIHFSGVAGLLKEKLEGEFADCDALVLDLRGRGGSGGAIAPMLSVLAGRTSTWDKPIVALINHHSRSAKDVIAYELRKQKLALLVGENTAGAVIPATFADVGHDTVLMFPMGKFGKYTDQLEGVGVRPDVVVREAEPHLSADLLLQAGLREAVKLAKARPRSKSSVRASAADKMAESGASEDLPSAEEIIKRSIKALGGRKAILKHAARTDTGTIEISGMLSGKLVAVAAAPNRFAARVELDGFGTIRSGYDGKVGWRIQPQQGAMLLEGQDLSDMQNEADFYAPLHYFERYHSIEAFGRTTFGGKECYRLEAVDTAGAETSLFFDVKTFLPMGLRLVREVHMGGEATITVINEEFKRFDGVMVATRTRQTIGDIQEVVSTITDVSFESVEESAFDLPQSIRELLKSQ